MILLRTDFVMTTSQASSEAVRSHLFLPGAKVSFFRKHVRAFDKNETHPANVSVN